MKSVIILVILFVVGCWGEVGAFEADTNGIAIVIIQNRFDNAWSDTIRDTCICYHIMDGKNWKIVHKKYEKRLPYPQFLIIEVTK